MKKINEGLRENDLEGLVLPVLSIDEYESKIDDDGIVVGFYTQYKEPANDLNRFIQKSAIDMLDSEISPAPTEDGFYVVFVELERDKDFVSNLLSLLNSLNTLVGYSKWQFKTLNQSSIIDLSEESLTELIRIEPEDDDTTEENIEEFFKYSILDDLLIENKNITFIKNNHKATYEILGFSDYEMLQTSDYRLTEGVQLHREALRLTRKLAGFLGPHWLIEHLVHCIVLSHENSRKAVVLKI